MKKLIVFGFLLSLFISQVNADIAFPMEEKNYIEIGENGELKIDEHYCIIEGNAVKGCGTKIYKLKQKQRIYKYIAILFLALIICFGIYQYKKRKTSNHAL